MKLTYDDIVSAIVVGDFGCFTDPTSKVERASYPIMTPSAAKSLIAQIHGKPEFNWEILKIELLSFPKFFVETRKEFIKKAPRKNKILINPKYRVFAKIIPEEYINLDGKKIKTPNKGELVKKHMNQFKSNIRRGKYYKNPYMGLSQYRAEILEDDESILPVDYNDEFTMFFGFKKNRNPIFFNAKIDKGTMIVPNISEPANNASKIIEIIQGIRK